MHTLAIRLVGARCIDCSDDARAATRSEVTARIHATRVHARVRVAGGPRNDVRPANGPSRDAIVNRPGELGIGSV